jgi:hypothetical protein
MLETFKTYIIGEWKVIRHAPATILMVIIFIIVVLWAAFNWSYGAIVANQSAEMRLMERQIKDYERQVDALQKKPAIVSSDLANSADLVLEIFDNERTPSRISYDNIWRWYYLRTIMIGIEKDTGKQASKQGA